MEWSEKVVGTKEEVTSILRGSIDKLVDGQLVVAGQAVAIPGDVELSYKVKYEDDQRGGKVVVKVSWPSLGWSYGRP